jgi:CheY-like chemotaxis protein
MSVLIVDDSQISAKIMEVTLRKRGYETLYAQNGKQALQILERRGDLEVVITDLIMPDMEGLELLAKIRSIPDFCGLPVVLCSVAADEDKVRKAASLGCRHYLVKPVNPSVLIERVEEAIKDSKPILRSPTEMMQKFGIDRATYEELKSKFRSSLEGALEGLESSSHASSSELQVVLSRLSEEAALFGARRLLDALGRKESPGGRSSPCGGSKTEALKGEIRRLLKFLSGQEHLGNEKKDESAGSR